MEIQGEVLVQTEVVSQCRDVSAQSGLQQLSEGLISLPYGDLCIACSAWTNKHVANFCVLGNFHML
jgi:hypothetical protein